MTKFKAGLEPLRITALTTVILVSFAARVSVQAGTPMPFVEEAAVRGVVYNTGTVFGQFGVSVAFADLDNDMNPDLIALGRIDGIVGIYKNDGNGFFTDRSIGNGIPLILSPSGVIAGDYDADGDLDLYFSNWATADMLLRNEGGFQFTDVTVSAGLGDIGNGQGSAWGDYDGDGWIDLYLGNRTSLEPGDPPCRLYHNMGDGTFIDVAPALGVDDTQPTYQASFFDFDKDGDADLYLANDKGSNNCNQNTNRLYENVGGTFVEITGPSGTAACVDSMSTAIGDFDGNLFQDLYVTNTPQGNALMLNQGDGTFTRDEIAAGVASFAMGWGSVFFDWDNNGMLDLFVCNVQAPNRLYSNFGTFPVTEMATSLGLDDVGFTFTAAVADIDNDGDLDLAYSNAADRVKLCINQEGQVRSWIKFDVIGRGQNTFAIGANIEARTGATWRIREVIAGCNFKSQNQLIQHFGLGSATQVDEVVVMWPGGVTRSLTNVPINGTWRIYPPEKLGDGDSDGDIDMIDAALLVDVLLGLDSNMDHFLLNDMNGDSSVDGVDLQLFVEAMLGLTP
ncbi:MAG: CRTAC1 family protein [Phycisphaerae bacterium]